MQLQDAATWIDGPARQTRGRAIILKAMAMPRKTMNDNIQYLSKRLAGYCIFINDKYQLLLIAPQKCGSTSILKSLYDRLVEPSREYENTFSHEYTKELCIHTHLKSTQDCSPTNLKRIFADQNYQKILVARDPIDRLCSSICSKYLLESTPFFQREIKKKRTNDNQLSQPYTNTDDFLNDFNEIANILLTKGTIFEDEKASHASPISDIVPKELLPFFYKIIDITKKEGWASLKASINQHLSKHPDHPQIEDFPHLNENSLSQSRRFLSSQNIAMAFGRYSEDYQNLPLKLSHPDEHTQTPPSTQELKSLNTFISLANRSVDLFNIGKRLISTEREIAMKKHQYEFKKLENECTSKLKSLREMQQAKLNAAAKNNAHRLSELTIKKKQLAVFEEISRRTAEELLIESHELKELNNQSQEEIRKLNELNSQSQEEIRKLNELNSQSQKEIRILSDEISIAQKEALKLKKSHTLELKRVSLEATRFFRFYSSTKDLKPTILIRRAEKRIKNKNFKSAKELLLQAYCMNKTNQGTLLRLLAVSTRNPVIRSLMIWITSLTIGIIKK